MALLHLYLECLRRTAQALARNAWTLLLPVVYIAAWLLVSPMFAPLGIVGGFLLALVSDALMASFLYFVSELAGRMPVRPRELPRSVVPYFWPLMNFLFVLWLGGLLLRPVLSQQPGLAIALEVVLFILLNAVPEVIHRGGAYGSMEILSTALQFVQTNWLEWFPPNLLLGAALWFGVPWLASLPVAWLAVPLVAGAFVHAAMVFRGFLFDELRGSTPRQRAMRYRLGA